MKQRRQIPRLYNRRWRSCLGDLSMRRSIPSRNRTIVVQLKLTDAATAVEAALPILDELSRQIQFEQQRQQIAHLQLSAQINLTLSFHGSETATATIAQAIDNSAYQLEELQSTGQLAHFELSYKSLD